MKNVSWLSQLSNQRPSGAMINRIAGSIGVAILLVLTGVAVAQNPAAPAPAPESTMSVPQGYSVHESVDLGGHITNVVGSGEMYDTLVNLHSGPRVQDEMFELRALPGTKNTLIDSLQAMGSGFGGDPNNFAKLTFSKDKFYEFSGIFRRDRQYFDYDLLGNPNITTGLSIPIGPSNAPTGSFAWPQVEVSPLMFNTVRRMTDTDLTILPLSKVTLRIGYSHNIFQGPTLSPGESVGKYNSLLAEYQRNGTDDLTFGADWKPVQGTRLTYEEEITHYKQDSYFTIAPSEYMFQEADGTPVSVGDWDSQTAYGIGGCITGSMGSAYTSSSIYTILSAPQTSGGKPIINPACDVITSYLRSQRTRLLYPTEIFRLQSSSIKNITMSGNFRYTKAKMNLPYYYENFQGLDGVAATTTAPIYPAQAIRSATFTGSSSAQREVVAADYGIVWQLASNFSLSEQIDYSNVHQPGTSNISLGITANTSTNPNETINYSGPLGPGSNLSVEGSPNGTPLPDYFGQKFVTNSLTGTWDTSARTTLSLTYRYRTHTIGEGIPNNAPLAVAADTNGTVTIDENGGIFTAALRPAANWDLNGSAEISYADNAFTPVAPRQLQHYRVHTIYRPKTWATISGAYNDLERHNNTNNNQSAVALYASSGGASGVAYDGPINHVDHSRNLSLGTDLEPNEHYGLDLNYSYSDVYAATNICYLNGATATLPGAATVTSSGAADICPGAFARGSTTNLDEWEARDFMDAPTQSGSAAFMMSPSNKTHVNVGYRISSVDGSRFFNDARDVNGSLVSKYQSPFMNVAVKFHPGWVWNAEYRLYRYFEGGFSGAPLCSTAGTNLSASTPVISCTSASIAAYPTGLTEPTSGLTAARNFYANDVTVGLHYEF
jgi:hypothetical protein